MCQYLLGNQITSYSGNLISSSSQTVRLSDHQTTFVSESQTIRQLMEQCSSDNQRVRELVEQHLSDSQTVRQSLGQHPSDNQTARQSLVSICQTIRKLENQTTYGTVSLRQSDKLWNMPPNCQIVSQLIWQCLSGQLDSQMIYVLVSVRWSDIQTNCMTDPLD